MIAGPTRDVIDAVCRKAGVTRGQPDRLAALSLALFDQGAPFHGLTQSARSLLELAAGLHAAYGTARPEGPVAALCGPGFPETLTGFRDQWERIVEDAWRMADPGADAAGLVRRCRSAPREVPLQVAARLAAILRLAAALSPPGGPAATLAGVSDGVNSVELLVQTERGRRSCSARGMAACALWNGLFSEPIAAVRTTPAAAAGAPLVRPQESTGQVAHRILLREWHYFFSRAYGIPYPDDTEFVHEMRVAVRRMRCALSLFAEDIGPRAAALRRSLREIGASLGAARDADVFLAFLRRERNAAHGAQRPCLDRLLQAEQRKRRRRYGALARLRSSPAYGRLRACGARWRAEAPRAGRTGERIADGAPRLLLQELKRVRQYRRRLGAYSNAELHRLRIGCKRARYAADFLCDVYPNRLDSVTGIMREMQRLLGDVHDADAYAERIRLQAARFPECLGGRKALHRIQPVLARLDKQRKRSLKEASDLWRTFVRGGAADAASAVRRPFTPPAT